MHIAKPPCSLLVLLLLVLALFGEQFARQFLSQTFTWYDHLIFACVPLGIMTAIAGAIRVEGRPVLKAFIGRARENKAAAEIEYMSSTSAEVGELFNGRGIVRTMGQSNIAQFIVFTQAFSSDKTTFGIHTLESATEKGNEVIRKEDYRDELDARFSKWLEPFKFFSKFRKNELEDGAHNQVVTSNYWPSLQYPNLQLNIAARGITAEQRSVELHLAAVTAIILQTSLLVIAAVIPYRVSGFEQKPWGLPCYTSGSVLLFIGMLACSVAIERSTKEYNWFSNDSNSPKGKQMSLFWVQGKQRVSDQEFGSYIIYAQDKEFLSTSSRKEDVAFKAKNNNDPNEISYQRKLNIETQGLTKNASEKLVWNRDIRAVTAIFAGGAGFTVQFIGLRGLPWPVAVAHLGAIIVMAMIRALVRRRLGEDTPYREVQSEYELDYLAIQLVETHCCTRPPLENCTKSRQEVLSWRVATAKHGKGTIHSLDYPCSTEPGVAYCKQGVLSHTSAAQSYETSDTEDPMTEAQKVMMVRKRLGDLCEWETRAFKPALSLARSIERFLDDFAPDGLSGEVSIVWDIPLRNSTDESGTVRLQIEKEPKGWKINAGEVEAILSVWMGNLEAQNMTQPKKDKDTEWQRSKAGFALGVDYCRLLGRKYDNGVLQRDINWWVGNPSISEVENEKQEAENTSSPEETTYAETPYAYDSSKHKNVKMVIGFTETMKANGSKTLLVQHSTAAKATIVVQHLFTHFIWTIVDRLPKDFLGQGTTNVHEFVSVEPPKKLDLLSRKSGTSRKLRHTKLANFVLHAEKERLGTVDEVLLCLIPVFSIKDRLPNDATCRFDLPNFSEGKDWTKKAPHYLALLESMSKRLGCVCDDSLALMALVYALDYLYMMALDKKYTGCENLNQANTELEQPEASEAEDLDTMANNWKNTSETSKQESIDDFQSLVNLISGFCPGVIRKLWLFYELQGRAESLWELKESCQERMEEEMWSLQPITQDKESFMEHIRFAKLHQHIANTHQFDLGELQGKQLETRDIFGWTALHYAAACDDLQVVGCNSAGQAALSDGKRLKDWWLDNFGRSPIHIACVSGNSAFLEILLANTSEQDVRSTLQSRGLDGMTPIHLAIAGGHENCLQALLKLSYFYELDFKEDAWKRSPIHLAIALGKYSCCTALLANGELKFKPSTLDILGKSSLSYLDEKNDEQHQIGYVLLSKYSEKFQYMDNEGQTVWHHATRFLSNNRFELYADELLITLREKHKSAIDIINNAQETPLHLAVHRKNDDLVMELLYLGANLSTNKDKHRSPLMLVCSLGRPVMVTLMLGSKSRAAEDRDGNGKIALHYVVESKECDDDDCLEIMEGLVKAMKTADMRSIDVQDNDGRTPLHIATQTANSSAVSFLLDSGADPNTKDNTGQNALHYASKLQVHDEESVKRMQEITQELLKKAPGCMDASDNVGDTPLTWACRLGTRPDFVRRVVDLSKHKGSKINLNQPDDRFGQSPLSWACENNQKDIVNMLLASTTVDLNYKSTFTDYTPLQLALKEENHEIVQMLVCDPKRHADINVANIGCPDLLEFACRESDEDCIKMLLLHPETKSSKFLTSAWKRAIQQPSRKEEMDWFVHEWEGAILEPQNNVPFPLHELAEVGRLERLQSLLQDDERRYEFDDNGWTPADVASRYGHNELAASLRQNNPPRDNNVNPYAEPSTFVNLFRGPELESSKCHSHDQRFHQTLDITLPKNDCLDDQFCYLRTKEPVAPNIECFYFEVKILHPLQKKICAVGFCQADVPEHSLPGWDKGSFAYHGDDGGFHVSRGSGDPQESDEVFDKDDVVGCGVNFKTGQGYRTKNGVLLGSSYRFKDVKFSMGRFYPCIGARTDGGGDRFQVQVTLQASRDHPFQYKGPYNGLLLRPEWDDDSLSVEKVSDTYSEGVAEEE
ncbi:hypothetical protein FAUST_11046 [Fusarium austroamericanum]|uniref:B30.2/SPRY domain-containing protein n=1 Tax=Fusarium austroamericanum TaxID=282268 RepID=A0AAN6BVH6_FUSAU|nr:hypothetical protein FAUST_11046 [Fusarium austroamericanum]